VPVYECVFNYEYWPQEPQLTIKQAYEELRYAEQVREAYSFTYPFVPGTIE
jgi:hypothetical protein